MSLSRRRFLASSAATAASLALLPRGLAADGAFRDLRAGVGRFIGKGGTIGWYASADAVLVVDAQFPDSAGDCIRGLAERSAHAIDALINTHHHGDHTAGNAVFRDKVAKIVAHRRVPELQRAAATRRGDDPQAEVVAGSTFDTEFSIDLGRESVTATHYGAAHTGGDCVVHFKNANVAHVGDLVFNRWHPFIDTDAGASIQGWIDVIDKIVAAHDDDTLYIFGHGSQEHGISGKAVDLLKQRDYFRSLLAFARRASRAEKSAAKASRIRAMAGFEQWESKGDNLSLATNIKKAYAEILKPE